MELEYVQNDGFNASSASNRDDEKALSSLDLSVLMPSVF